MDLLEIKKADKTNSGVSVELFDPRSGMVICEGKGKAKRPFTVTIVGTDSDVFRQFKNDRDRKDAQLAKQNRRGTINLSPEEQEQRITDSLVACTVGMFLIEDGKQVANTPAEYERIYNEYPWIRKQIMVKVFDDSTFFLVA